MDESKMTRDDIIRMVKEADLEMYLQPNWDLLLEFEDFAKRVAAAEREACAKVCEEDKTQAMEWTGVSRPGPHFARTIRARSQNDGH